jgi:phage shock protein PspC (stress-responsive transcriptional regulator)
MDSEDTTPNEEPTQPQEPDRSEEPTEAQEPDRSEEPTHQQEPTEETREQPRRITRSKDDRLISGVCGGLGRYFGVDPVLFRVAAVALIFFGGAGILLYIAAIFLIPEEGEDPPASRGRRERALAVVGVILLVVAAGIVFSHGPFHFGWVFGPFAFVVIAGLFAWWLVSGDRPKGGGRDITRAAARGVGMLIVCVALALGGAWAAGTGGATAAAIAVIIAGAALAGAALEGYGRWLILPALSLAIPVAFVSAANIDLHGGAGDKQYTPNSPLEVKDSYRLGAGRLVVDLRDAQLPPGDHPLKLKVGVGEARLIVPDNVCVATKAKLGMGQVQAFDRENSGIDVDWTDLPSAPERNPRVLLDADVGIGHVEVAHTFDKALNDHSPEFDPAIDQQNTGCEVGHATR